MVNCQCDVDKCDMSETTITSPLDLPINVKITFFCMGVTKFNFEFFLVKYLTC